MCEVSFQHDRQSQCCHRTKAWQGWGGWEWNSNCHEKECKQFMKTRGHYEVFSKQTWGV
jgi:hypothetical protein